MDTEYERMLEERRQLWQRLRKLKAEVASFNWYYRPAGVPPIPDDFEELEAKLEALDAALLEANDDVQKN